MILLLSLIMFVSPIREVHPFFVSVTEIEYVQKDKLLGISCKLFSDDLEFTLKNLSEKNVDILKGDKNTNKKLIATYFDRHFSLVADGKTLPFRVIGYENEGEAIFIYIEAPVEKVPAKLVVKTDLLYDLNPGQINMVHYIVNGHRQSHKMSAPQKEIIFDAQ
jgi:hypothetical protein